MDRIKKNIKDSININLSKTKFNTLEMILIFIMALVFGILIGEAIFKGNGGIKDLSSSTSSELYEIKEVYNTIVSEYIDEIDKEELKEAAINGMLESLDDKHTSYFDKQETEEFQTELNGSFTGFGIAVSKEKEELITVKEVYKNSPADKAGLKEGDQFLKVNGEDATKMTADELSNKIRGKQGTYTVSVKRKNEEKTLKITTGQVELPSVFSKIIKKDNKKIGYINLSIFASNTDEQLKEKIKELNKEDIKDIVLDLRYNQGGELDTVINVASEFLKKRTPIIRIEAKDGTDIQYSKGNTNPEYNIIVLINSASASGSEALAAALNEQLRAPLIGITTYGKGSVQKTKQLPNGTIIKYTIETWKTSKGKSIEKVGVKPTIQLKQSNKYYETLKDEDDIQLQKALEELTKKS